MGGGGVGEEKLAAALNRRAGPELRVLHDGRIPGSRANIDHLAVTPTGVYVIDAKRYHGAPGVRFSKPFGRGEKQLWVDGRKCTRLVNGVRGQMTRV